MGQARLLACLALAVAAGPVRGQGGGGAGMRVDLRVLCVHAVRRWPRLPNHTRSPFAALTGVHCKSATLAGALIFATFLDFASGNVSPVFCIPATDSAWVALAALRALPARDPCACAC